MKKSSTMDSKTDWPRVRALEDRNIRTSPKHPEADVKHIVRGFTRLGLKPIVRKTAR